MEIFLHRIETLTKHYGQATQDAELLLAVGDVKRGSTLDTVEHAAYTVLFSTIMNLDEALVKP